MQEKPALAYVYLLPLEIVWLPKLMAENKATNVHMKLQD